MIERKDRVRRTNVGFSSGSLKDYVEQKPTIYEDLLLSLKDKNYQYEGLESFLSFHQEILLSMMVDSVWASVL